MAAEASRVTAAATDSVRSPTMIKSFRSHSGSDSRGIPICAAGPTANLRVLPACHGFLSTNQGVARIVAEVCGVFTRRESNSPGTAESLRTAPRAQTDEHRTDPRVLSNRGERLAPWVLISRRPPTLGLCGPLSVHRRTEKSWQLQRERIKQGDGQPICIE